MPIQKPTLVIVDGRYIGLLVAYVSDVDIELTDVFQVMSTTLPVNTPTGQQFVCVTQVHPLPMLHGPAHTVIRYSVIQFVDELSVDEQKEIRKHVEAAHEMAIKRRAQSAGLVV
jgi:hypothetical protein